MTNSEYLAIGLDPTIMFAKMGWPGCDPWQKDLLLNKHPRVLLNCSRQAGKSTTVAALALHQALYSAGSLILLLSRAQRQASELFRKVLDFYNALDRPIRPISETALKIEFANNSRIVALPGKEANVRAYSGVSLLVIDEGARVPDDLYRSVRPMLATSGGRLICLSTPFGRRGFFWDAWDDKEAPWLRLKITADQCPRIPSDFLDEERRTLGDSWYRQEYECSFEALEGIVYPDFDKCITDFWTLESSGRKVGGIDWGWHNPFAAVWGVLDKQDVLWINAERYKSSTSLNEHFKHLPKGYTWYADPAGRTEIEEARCADFKVLAGDNSLRAGIAAVTSRIETGRLKVYRLKCHNLIEEAGLYRYPRPDEQSRCGENPVDEYNHALAALRYLVSRIDRKFMVKFRKLKASTAEPEIEPLPEEQQVDTSTHRLPWLRIDNEALWRR